MIEVDNRIFNLVTHKTKIQEYQDAYYEKRLSEITDNERAYQDKKTAEQLSVFDRVLR